MEDSNERIIKINIENEMKSSYIDYSMSVIVSRALPDVRDGLKPVHRRILYGLDEMGMFSNKPTRKSALVVGHVLGRYHPHGDSSVYDAMVRLAQPWNLRYALIEGQGNFGSIDGDGAAAMRYTEARLQKISEEVLADLDKNTVDFVPNYSEEYKEPTVLATKIPLLLVNGASGIAVGMATNMPTHNLCEVIDGIDAYIDNNDITIEELMHYVKGPDFPTGGVIYGVQGIKDAFETGRGKIVIRAKTEIEVADNGRQTIVVKELPYQVNPTELLEKIAALVADKKIEGIAYLNNESDRNGMRIVIKLKMDAVANVVLNNLFKMTQLQSAFSVNNIALVDGRPRLLNLKDLIKYFVRFRFEVIVRRAKYDLEQAMKRAHILEGLIIAVDNIDEVVQIIRSSKTRDEARTRLIERFSLSEIQANAILDMRLSQLVGLERDKLRAEYEEIQKRIEYLNTVINDVNVQKAVVKEELAQIKAKYGDARRTEIRQNEGEFNPEDFYADDDVVITISHLGYIKRTLLSEYRTQNRGGVGAKGGATRDEDFIEHIYVANMHSTMLFFTSNGKCYWLKVYEIPEGNKTSKGRAIQNVINIDLSDKVMAYINVKTLDDADYINNNFIVLCTKRGVIKKTSLEAYSRPRANGVNAITIREGDQLLEAVLTDGKSEILMAAREGKAIRFNESLVRAIGRTGAGVRGINIADTDEVIGMICVKSDDLKTTILVVSENGYGKRSELDDYRITNRGGKGVKTINITEKTGKLIAIKDVTEENDLMIINRSGLTIRLAVTDIRVAGRATQGVKLINIREKDAIAAVAKVSKSDEDEVQDTESAEKIEPANGENAENATPETDNNEQK